MMMVNEVESIVTVVLKQTKYGHDVQAQLVFHWIAVRTIKCQLQHNNEKIK